VAAIYAPYVDGVVTFEEAAPDAAEMMQRIAGGHPWLVAEGDGRVLGYASASPFRVRAAYRWAVEVGIYLAPDATGRGLGRALYAALLDRLAADGFAQAFASVSLPNPASAALHRALGFRPLGLLERAGYKAGRWVDVELWQRGLVAPTDPPAEPRLS
jgi:L-amino acid N-acyltransferase YncA